jgi:hypothetical protein
VGQQFDRVAIADSPTGPEYLVLESQVVIDFGQGQGPRGGVVSVLGGGKITVQGSGEARLDGGLEEPGGVFPPRLLLTSEGKPAVAIAAHPDPTGKPSPAPVSVEGTSATLRMRDADGNDHTLLDGAAASLWLGGKKADGDVVLFKKGQTQNRLTDKATLHLDGDNSTLTLRDGKGNDHGLLDGAAANLWLGGKKADGDVVLFKKGQTENRSTAKATLHLDGDNSTLTLRDGKGNDHGLLDGVGGDLWLGGKKASGAVVLFKQGETNNRTLDSATVHLSGEEGKLRIRDSQGNDHALLDGPKGDLWLGGKEASGNVILFKSGQTDNRNPDKATIHLDGSNGDIVLRNGDCAEDFEVAEGLDVEPGTVMAIDDRGRLRPSQSAYDRKVAGVISGAGSCRPGIVLGRESEHHERMPVALVGKVYCKVDASASPIAIGDLLTTSGTPGHAMKAEEPLRAFGAVIGKALGALETGTGLIPILVALQ